MSGMIALSLATQQAGSTERLREAIRAVLKSRLVTYEGAQPLSDWHPTVVHRRRLLDVCFDSTPTSRTRRDILDKYLNGDIRSYDVEHYGNVNADELLNAVSEAILPGALPLFARHRWLTSSEVIRESLLLFCIHHIGEQAIPRWVTSGKNGDDYTDDGLWSALVPRNVEEVDDASVLVGPDAAKTTWSKENDQHRHDALSWAASSPGRNLVIMGLSTPPQVQNDTVPNDY